MAAVDAVLLYVARVKDEFALTPEVYIQLVNVMKDYKYRK
jgi:histone deacetylase complex regulatory component SIN3